MHKVDECVSLKDLSNLKKIYYNFLLEFFKKTGFISSKSSLNHDTGEGHPENKNRIKSILERLEKKIFRSRME